MQRCIYFIAGGEFFMPAAILLAIAVAGITSRRGWVSIISLLGAFVAIITIVISATALPWWIYGVWGTAALLTIFEKLFRSIKLRKHIRVVFRTSTLVAVVFEISYQRVHPSPPAHCFIRLYVVGDSVSAGLGRPGEKTWPHLLATAHRIQVVDLSRAGCMVHEAVRITNAQKFSDGLVVIEIGGNDLISRTSAAAFGKELDDLIRNLHSPSRQLFMLELPLFPFDNEYGLEQRRIASRYQVGLIPRRCLANILSVPGNTTDGIHLTNAGQHELADLIWKVISPAMNVK